MTSMRDSGLFLSGLAARDERAAFQVFLLKKWGKPLASLTLVSPGRTKDSPSRRNVMGKAEQALCSALASFGYPVMEKTRKDGENGPEAVIAADCAAEELKRIAIGIEECEPWGRLVDADVIAASLVDNAPQILRREFFGLAPRRCLLCGNAAMDCIASGRHSPQALAAEAERLFALAAGELFL